MATQDLSWTASAATLQGPAFTRFHTELAKYNGGQLEPRFPEETWREEIDDYARVTRAEGEYVEAVRREISPLVTDIPEDVDGFIDWFEELKHTGPGQGDPLFPWLAEAATREDMLWFLTQEVAGEAGFDDLLAMTQVKMPVTAKLEMARNYWDEMGRGRDSAMHGPLLERLASYLDIDAQPDRVLPESLALGNAMLALARSRRYCFQSIGALGVIEMTAPTRAGFVDQGLKRLRIPTKKRLYFTLHAVLDIKHSECWNREVLRSLVEEDPRRAAAIGEGAVLRLWHGARCFDRYRQHFGLDTQQDRAAYKVAKMRFLGIGDAADLASLYLRLAEDGHEVKIYIGSPLCRGTLAGLVNQVADWQGELEWVRAAGRDGCILFENVGAGRGELQDRLRRDGLNVIGSSAYGARLENDRAYAQRILGELGLSTAAVFEFGRVEDARRFIEQRPARYVLKSNGPNAATFVGRHRAGVDVSAVLATDPRYEESSLILMEFIEGIEMGVGAYFNGEDFLEPACLDWEHKRFFPGDLGELTGEMGTVVTYSGSKGFFDRTLGKMRGLLKENGYCGYINLNTMVNERGIWPLEFTCRFGYPGYAILDPLQRTSWADLFRLMIARNALRFETEPGFAVGIVITTPPFPYCREQVTEPIGLPVLFDGDLSPTERRNLHYGEVGLSGGVLVTSGASGYTLVVTGTGETIAAARDAANALAEKIIVPNGRYRSDIGQRLLRVNSPGYRLGDSSIPTNPLAAPALAAASASDKQRNRTACVEVLARVQR